MLSEWHQRVVRETADLAFRLARLVSQEWGRTIWVPRHTFDKPSDTVEVVSCVWRVPHGDLVRVDFDSDEGMIADIRDYFRSQPRADMAGVANLVVKDFPPNAIVICSAPSGLDHEPVIAPADEAGAIVEIRPASAVRYG